MDFAKAAACAALAFVLTDFLKRAVPAKLPAAVLQLLAFAVSVGTIFLVGATTWAHQNVIGSIPLDKMSVWDKVVAGLIIGGGATFIDRLGLIQSRAQDAPAAPAVPAAPALVPETPVAFPGSSDDIFPAG